jgi:hypothetical protein
MTTTNNSLWGVVWSAVRAAAVVPAALCLMQCSADQAAGDDGPEKVSSVTSGLAACGSIACASLNDCTSVTNLPLCAKSLSAVCHSVSHECTWQLKNDPACPCLERDVRLCMVNATTPGVQICTANAGRTATFWDTCIACPSCT